MNKPKYNIGDVIYYVESNTNYGLKTPCTMCFGNLCVTIILGDGTHQDTQCGFCIHGSDSPSGFAYTYEPRAVILTGSITGVSIHNYSYLYSIGHSSFYEYKIYETRSLAEVQRKLEKTIVDKKAKEFFEKSFIIAKKDQIWSTGYHKNCIKREEKSILWHKLRLCKIKDRNK